MPGSGNCATSTVAPCVLPCPMVSLLCTLCCKVIFLSLFFYFPSIFIFPLQAPWMEVVGTSVSVLQDFPGSIYSETALQVIN